ncbi:MAG: type III secretion system chaperone [Pirellulales bacterium]|nr:type III secretion system chaperone [Pirellulales bacterium]
MDTLERTRQLVGETAQLLDLKDFVESDDDSTWLLVVDDDTAVAVELDDSQTRLLLVSDIGLPDEEARTRLLELILAYNSQWGQTGGVWLATDEPGGRVQQMMALSHGELDPPALAGIVVNFLTIQLGWREIIAAAPSQGDLAPDFSDPSDQPHLRV